MPMDDYDFNHKTNYEHIINIYSNSNIENTVNNFLEESKLEIKDYSVKEIISRITYIQNSLKILDYRHITNIGARICVYINNTPVWILLQVWRGAS
jgi:hypothetical protein